MLDTLLFDLDGTLLPLEQDTFVRAYFSELTKVISPLGYQPQELIDAIWHGTHAMMKNDGSRLNHDLFWDDFSAIFGEAARSHEPQMDRFYAGPFDKARRATLPRASLRGMMSSLRAKGYTLVLATNPVFPLAGVATRLNWIGLAPEDFDLVTSYENSRFCKPNPRYYQEVLYRLKKSPDNCLMCGNDVQEDMVARQLGMEVFLVTDHLEHAQGADLNAYPHGSFQQLQARLAALPNILHSFC